MIPVEPPEALDVGGFCSQILNVGRNPACAVGVAGE